MTGPHSHHLAHDANHAHSHDATAQALDARAKIFIFFSLIIIGVSTPAESWRAFAVYFAFAAALVLALGVPTALFLKRILVVIPFVLMVAVFMPFFRRGAGDVFYPVFGGALEVSRGGLLALANAALKGTLGVAALVTLSAATPFHELLAGFRWFRVPAVLVDLTGFVYRYIFVLAEEAERMKLARDSRGYRGRWLWHTGAVGMIVGTLLLRSFERAERIHAAMLSRGYDGALPAAALPAPRATDFLAAAAAAAILASTRWFLA